LPSLPESSTHATSWAREVQPRFAKRFPRAGRTYQFTFNPDRTYRLLAQNYMMTIPGSPGSSVMSFLVTVNPL
jgi:hypothetical protein